MAVIIGQAACYGDDERWQTLPINNIPPDAFAVERVTAHNDFATAIVHRPSIVETWLLQPDPDHGLDCIKNAKALKLGSLRSRRTIQFQ